MNESFYLGAQAVSTLQDFIASKKDSSLRASLALVQLHLQQGSVSLAIEALKSLGPEAAYRPGVVATVVALLKNLEEKDAAIDYLSAAIAFNKEKDCLDAETLESLMRTCASAMLAAGMNARAVTVLEELRRRHPKDLRVLAQLITAYATVDPVAAQKVRVNYMYTVTPRYTGPNSYRNPLITDKNLSFDYS